MRLLGRAVVAVSAILLATAACDAQHVDGTARQSGRPPGQTFPAASPSSPSRRIAASVATPGFERSLPNPGSGRGDPRLAAALLTRFHVARQTRDLPGAVVALPLRDRRALFIGLRQVSSPLVGGRECDGWTGGLWLAAVGSFERPGVQLAVTRLSSYDRAAPPSPRQQSGGRDVADHVVFSEALISGPPAVLDRLARPLPPASCRHLSGPANESGAVQPLAVPRLGPGSYAYRITGGGRVPVWQWVEVVTTPRYVLEIRIPNQAPAPRAAPAALLPMIARAAYLKAHAALR